MQLTLQPKLQPSKNLPQSYYKEMEKGQAPPCCWGEDGGADDADTFGLLEGDDGCGALCGGGEDEEEEEEEAIEWA